MADEPKTSLSDSFPAQRTTKQERRGNQWYTVTYEDGTEVSCEVFTGSGPSTAEKKPEIVDLYALESFSKKYEEFRNNDSRLAPTADFLIHALNLKAGDRVFDQCCAGGYLSLALARRGMETVGIDLAEKFVKYAQQKAKQQNLKQAFFEVADAYTFKTDKPCDAAINWFSSSGHSQDDNENLKMFQRAYESLKPGGRFAIEYTDYRNEDDFNFSGGKHIIDGQGVESHNYLHHDYNSGMLTSNWVYTFPDGTIKELPPGEMRMYSPQDLQNLLEKAGFRDVELKGGLEGQALAEADNRQMIAIAHKPDTPHL